MQHRVLPEKKWRKKSTNQKEDWNRRAKDNAYFYVSSFRKKWDDKSFYEWGEIQTQIVIDPFLKTQKLDPSTLSVLEIGCGPGRMSRALASRFKHVFAYDVSEQYIHLANAKNNHLKNITFITNNGMSFPEIEDGSIDFAFSGWTMQHMPTKNIVSRNIQEIARVLKIGGSYKIDPITISSKLREKIIAKAFNSKLVKSIAPIFRIDKQVLNPTWRGARFENKEILNILDCNGLTVNTITEDDGLSRFHGKKATRQWFYGKKNKISTTSPKE